MISPLLAQRAVADSPSLDARSLGQTKPRLLWEVGERKGASRIPQSERSELDSPLLGHQPVAFEDGHVFITPGDLFPEIA